MKIIKILPFFLLVLLTGCSVGSPDVPVNPKSLLSGTVLIPIPIPIPTPQTPIKEINYLALGDSYTIGQSVCETCRFPEQLKKAIGNVNSLKIIAQTGWTTTNLISAINAQNPTPNYDLVTLLIGVNNQYQNIPFSVYENEFPELVNKAIALGKGDKTNVIVVSIPDYAFTPYGKQTSNQSKISSEIDKYNAFAQKYCLDNNIEFITITDITRKGLLNPLLVAQDGLHPSELAYSLFVERILPKAIIALQN
jgi:acyl-CoA thioesterase I